MNSQKKSKKFNFTVVLIATYVIMVCVCCYLTTHSNRDLSSTAVNIAMFFIVGVIFLIAALKFEKVRKISEDLDFATNKMENDHLISNGYLWDVYKNQEEELFHVQALATTYKEYVKAMKSLEQDSNGNFSCDIEEYIDRELIDYEAKKNLLSLIPGTMTGLGILGTFIGLSFGLQNFNTGSAAEISNSIAPLMDGIKVAFHTSIYGMVFSLVFNYLFKQVMENAYVSLDRFLKSYDSYVRTSSERDNEKYINIVLQQIPERIGQVVVDRMTEALTPSFDRLNQTLNDFAEVVSANQLEGVSKIVDSFISEMNKSLGDSFTHLGKVMEETSRLQEENNVRMGNILDRMNETATNIKEINDISQKTIESFTNYVVKVESLQQVLNDNFMNVNVQLEAQKEYEKNIQEYVSSITAYQNQVATASMTIAQNMSEQVERSSLFEKNMMMEAQSHMGMLNKHAQAITESMATTSEDMMAAMGEFANTQLAQSAQFEQQMLANAQSHMEMLTKEVQAVSDGLTEVSRKWMNEISNFTSNSVRDIKEATKELAQATANYDGRIENTLRKTCDVFDQTLADISMHLSGTISEIEATTGRVPQVVEAAYSGMKKTFAEMQRMIDDLHAEIEKMTQNMN